MVYAALRTVDTAINANIATATVFDNGASSASVGTFATETEHFHC